MIELETRSLGKMQVNPDDYLQFEDGLLGFTDTTEFIIIPDPGDSPFEWLQATQNSELAFIILKPGLVFGDNYNPVIAPSDLELLKVADVKECTIYTIVTIPAQNPEKMTANLQGPILINESARIARQVISLNDQHIVRMPILEQVAD